MRTELSSGSCELKACLIGGPSFLPFLGLGGGELERGRKNDARVTWDRVVGTGIGSLHFLLITESINVSLYTNL